MSNIDRLNGKYIGYPCTPSRWTKEPEYKKISVITMTCGGGMGGSNWKEYVERVGIPEGIQEYKTIEGKTIKLNSNYIVKVEEYTLVTVFYETSNSNYYPETRTLGAKVSYTKWIPLKRSFLIEDGETVNLIEEYAERAKAMNRTWRIENGR